MGHMDRGSALKKGGLGLKNGQKYAGVHHRPFQFGRHRTGSFLGHMAIVALLTVTCLASAVSANCVLIPDETERYGPTADFAAKPTNGSCPLWVNFTDSTRSLDGIVSWYWDFGDNSTSTERNPTHKYAQPGNYTVTLTVREKDGELGSEVKRDYIRVSRDITRSETDEEDKGDGVPPSIVVPTDSNIRATVQSVKATFMRKDAQWEYSLVEPISICHDSRGRFLLADSARHEVFVLNEKLQIEGIIGNTTESTIPIFWVSSTEDLAVDSHGRVYLCDIRFSAVHVLDSDFRYLGRTTLLDTWSVAHSVAVDSQGRLLVAVFRPSGESGIYVFRVNMSDPTRLPTIFDRFVQICPPGQGCTGAHGNIRDIAVDSEDRIIVVEGNSMESPYTARLVVLDSSFRWMFSVGGRGSEPGNFLGPGAVAVGPAGTIIVADAATDMLSFFFANGTYSGRIGREGSEPGEFKNPAGLLATDSGQVFVLELRGKRMQQLSVDFASLRPMVAVYESPVLAFGMLTALSLVGIQSLCRCGMAGLKEMRGRGGRQNAREGSEWIGEPRLP